MHVVATGDLAAVAEPGVPNLVSEPHAHTRLVPHIPAGQEYQSNGAKNAWRLQDWAGKNTVTTRMNTNNAGVLYVSWQRTEGLTWL